MRNTMSAVQLNEELNDSTISTSQNHEGTKKRKKRKHKAAPGDDQPADISVNTTTVDGVVSEEKRKHKKKKRDRSSENNDSIIEPSQSDTIESKSKRHKSKSEDKPQKEAEIDISEDQEPENVTTTEEKRKEKKKKRDRSSEKNDSVTEPSQSNVVQNKRKRRKSQIEEEQPKETEFEPEQDKDSMLELTQGSRRKRRKSNQVEEVPKETRKGPEQDSGEEGNMLEDTFDNRLEEDVVDMANKSDNENFNLKKADIIICGSENGQIEEEDIIMSVDKERHLEDVNGIESGESVSSLDESCEEVITINGNPIPSDEEDFITTSKKQNRPDRKKFISTNEKLSLPKKEGFNEVEEEEKKVLRRSNRKSVAENQEMSEQDQKMLLARMLSILPECDGVSYVHRLEEFEWNDVKFGNFSVKNCQEQFNRIVSKIRKSRTLYELIHDAQKSSKKVRAVPKAKPIAKRTAFQLYLKKKVDAYLQKHPGSKREDATKKYRSKWAALNDEEKVKYIRKAEDHNTKFQEEVVEKCHNDPSYKPPKQISKLSKEEQKILDKVEGIPPRPPASGYLLFCEIMKERLRTEMSDISSTDLMVEIGHSWSALSEEKKEHYKRKTEKKKHKYLEFLDAHPEIGAKVNADKRNKIVVKKTVNRIFDGEPVKPPTSGYMLFSKEILLTLKDLPSRDRMLEAAKRWAALSEEKKTEYNEKAKAAVNFYLTELEAFKEKLSPEDLQQYEEIHKKTSPKTPKKSPSTSPSKEIAGRQMNPPSDANKKVVGKRKKPSSKKAKSKSPIPNMKSVTNNGRAGDDDTDKLDKGNTSDASSEAF